jgi:hypothetical protein
MPIPSGFRHQNVWLQMIQWPAAGPGKRMMLFLHHNDSVREWAYDRESHVGRLDKGLDIAMEKEWTIINMKKDWNVVYPFEKKSGILYPDS